MVLATGRFSVALLALFAFCAAWFDAGDRSTVADEPRGAAVETETVKEEPLTAADRSHWAYRPLAETPAPRTGSPWVRNWIDEFILSRMVHEGSRPAAEAGRGVLARRLYFNLTGLPPTPGQLEEFLRDPAPDAYERLVDRLLGSPQHGDFAAQAWLDLARFAETDGFEHDKVRKDSWRYRDWVIDALNRDLPYDQFLSLQIAGDEITPGSPEARWATGFCLSGPDMPDINSQEERLHSLLNELTSTVGSVFLAMQMGCAQCHDHRYDPISQLDFYRFRSFFDPSVRVKKNQSVAFMLSAEPTESRLMIRGDWRRRGPPLQPGFPRVVTQEGATRTTVAPPGRRKALARWMTDPRNPLTGRVIVNRIWQQHFGEALARSPSDFGQMGEEPSHPQLLDALSRWFIQQGWRTKRLRRLIVTSATYRQPSRPAAGKAARAAWIERVKADPENRLLTRFPRRRLSGEAIRDAMLFASGALVSRRGGPGVRPPLPAELLKTLLKNQWNVSRDKADHYRRSVYVFARRNLRYPLFEAFDRPDPNATCPRRGRSTTAPQSLMLLNSELSATLAQRLAGRALQAKTATARVDRLFALVFARRPSAAERADVANFLREQTALISLPGRAAEPRAPIPAPSEMPVEKAAAWTDLCLALLNANEFMYID